MCKYWTMSFWEHGNTFTSTSVLEQLYLVTFHHWNSHNMCHITAGVGWADCHVERSKGFWFRCSDVRLLPSQRPLFELSAKPQEISTRCLFRKVCGKSGRFSSCWDSFPNLTEVVSVPKPTVPTWNWTQTNAKMQNKETFVLLIVLNQRTSQFKVQPCMIGSVGCWQNFSSCTCYKMISPSPLRVASICHGNKQQAPPTPSHLNGKVSGE